LFYGEKSPKFWGRVGGIKREKGDNLCSGLKVYF